MLEETLKLINQNLERIASAIEKKNESAPKLASGDNTAFQNNNPINVVSVPEQISVQPQVNAAPVQAPVSQVVSTAIPVTQTNTTFTQDQLAVAMSNAVTAGKMSIIQNILQSFGVQALTQINPNDYNKLATMLKEAGVEV